MVSEAYHFQDSRVDHLGDLDLVPSFLLDMVEDPTAFLNLLVFALRFQINNYKIINGNQTTYRMDDCRYL